ncbi:MAG: hypothetical protein JSU66_09425 [Deltaproteobacteria bacterium]|nr:MAG: hypothetical protein JSU66_09425 [Deltaproteobacteria bacterium]
MKVESQAGKFVLSFEDMEPGDDEIVITGKMGLWDAKTHMSLPEFVAILRMTLRPRMIGFLVRALFRGGFRARTQGAE